MSLFTGQFSFLICALPVDPCDNLTQPSARILRVGRIRIRRRYLAERHAGRTGEGRTRRVPEVNVVERVDKLPDLTFVVIWKE